MIREMLCALALLVPGQLAVAQQKMHDPVPRGTEETRPNSGHDSRHESTSSGFTLDKLHGMPMTRQPLPTYQMYSQPYAVYNWYPAYSYARPYSLGGYYPQRSVGSGRLGVWLWVP